MVLRNVFFTLLVICSKSRVDHYPVVVFRFISVTKSRGRGFDRSHQFCVTIMPIGPASIVSGAPTRMIIVGSHGFNGARVPSLKKNPVSGERKRGD